MRFLSVLLLAGFCAATANAAAIDSNLSSLGLTLTEGPFGVTSTGLRSIGCQGYTFFGTEIMAVSPTVPPTAALFQTEFTGANPNCTFHTESRLPGLRNYYAGPGLARRQEGVHRFSRAVFQNVCPGVDVIYEVDGWRAQIIYSLESAEHASAIRVRLRNLSVVPVPHTDVRDFAPSIRASVRAVEIMTFGTRPIAVEVLASDSVSFRLPSAITNPVQIILEAEFPQAAADTRPSMIDPRGGFYEAEGSIIRKFGQDGILIYETELAGGRVSQLLAGPDDTIFAIGSTLSTVFPTTAGTSQAMTRIPMNALSLPPGEDITVTRLDSTTGRLIYSTFFGGAGSENSNFSAIDDSGRLFLLASSNSVNFPRRGTPITNDCIPLRTINSATGNHCQLAILLSAFDGTLLYSKLLPAFTADAKFGSDGTLYLLLNEPNGTLDRVDAFDPTGTSAPALGFALPAELRNGSLAVDSAGGVWVSATGGLYSTIGPAAPQRPAGSRVLTSTAICFPSRPVESYCLPVPSHSDVIPPPMTVMR